MAALLIGSLAVETVLACTPFRLTDFPPKIVYEDTGPGSVAALFVGKVVKIEQPQYFSDVLMQDVLTIEVAETLKGHTQPIETVQRNAARVMCGGLPKFSVGENAIVIRWEIEPRLERYQFLTFPAANNNWFLERLTPNVSRTPSDFPPNVLGTN